MVRPLDETALTSLPMSGGQLEVAFENREDVCLQRRKFIANKGLFVSTTVQARPFSEFALVMRLPDGTRCEPLPARLVQVVPYGDQRGLMLQLLCVPDAVQRALCNYLARPEKANPPQPTTRGEPALGEEGQSPGRMTLHERLRKLRPDERSRLAARANKLERSVLIRDTEPLVLLFLLKNPYLTRAEVIEISRLKTLNHQVISQILGHKVWAQIEELRYNLAINPKTPLSISLKLLPSLNPKHQREMAKNHGLKNQLKQAALRLVLKHAEGG